MKPALAKDIMVTKLLTVSPRMHVLEAIQLLVKNSFSGAPVVDEQNNYLGIFSEKCCMRLFGAISEAARQQQVALPTLPDARQLMPPRIVTLNPSADVVKAIGDLLNHHISGAPVVDSTNRFLGVFSEKTSMSVLIQAAYEQLPSTEVAAFMNTDFGRTILEDMGFLDCARLFRETPYRRLPVLRGGKLVGQVSRRDLLRNSMALVSLVQDRAVRLSVPAGDVAQSEDACGEAGDRVQDFLDTDASSRLKMWVAELARVWNTEVLRLPLPED
jgi:CBS domain-containing protein